MQKHRFIVTVLCLTLLSMLLSGCAPTKKPQSDASTFKTQIPYSMYFQGFAAINQESPPLGKTMIFTNKGDWFTFYRKYLPVTESTAAMFQQIDWNTEDLVYWAQMTPKGWYSDFTTFLGYTVNNGHLLPKFKDVTKKNDKNQRLEILAVNDTKNTKKEIVILTTVWTLVKKKDVPSDIKDFYHSPKQATNKITKTASMNKNGTQNQTNIPHPRFNISQLVPLSDQPYNIQFSIKRDRPFSSVPKIGYRNFVDTIAKVDYHNGEQISQNGYTFDHLYTASKKDPYAAWVLGSKDYRYGDYAFATTKSLRQQDEVSLIIMPGAHTIVTSATNEKGEQLKNITKDQQPDFYSYTLESGQWVILTYDADIAQLTWTEKVKFIWE